MNIIKVIKGRNDRETEAVIKNFKDLKILFLYHHESLKYLPDQKSIFFPFLIDAKTRSEKLKWKWKWLICVWFFATAQFMEFSRPEFWSGYLSLLQGIFPTQGSNLGLLHYRQMLYQLSYQGWGACLKSLFDYLLLCSKPLQNAMA